MDSLAEIACSCLVGRTIAAVERDLIIQTLRRCNGNRSAAAKMLGISHRTVRYKTKQYAAEGYSVPGGRDRFTVSQQQPCA